MCRKIEGISVPILYPCLLHLFYTTHIEEFWFMTRTSTIVSVALALALCLGAWGGISPARADGCFSINVDALDMDLLRDTDYVAQHLSSDAPTICVQKYISDSYELAAQVRVTLTQMDTQTLIFDKNYGFQSGTFNSGDIYLPYGGNQTVPYLITVYVADWVFALPFMHQAARLEENSACTYGVRMRDYNPALTSDWHMGTMIDLGQLRSQGSINVPICSSNSYLVGEARVSLSLDLLTVDLALVSNANVQVLQCTVYCIMDVASLSSADPARINQPGYGVGQPIDVSGASSALLYMPMRLSYNSAGLSTFTYDLNQSDLQYQLALWNQNASQGLPPATPEPTYEQPFIFLPEEDLPQAGGLLPTSDEPLAVE